MFVNKRYLINHNKGALLAQIHAKQDAASFFFVFVVLPRQETPVTTRASKVLFH